MTNYYETMNKRIRNDLYSIKYNNQYLNDIVGDFWNNKIDFVFCDTPEYRDLLTIVRYAKLLMEKQYKSPTPLNILIEPKPNDKD